MKGTFAHSITNCTLMSKYQSKLDRLNQDLESLLAYLSSFPSEKLKEKPSPTAWSVVEVMQHLMLAERLSVGYVRKKIQYPHGLKKPGIENRVRLLLLRFFMDAPIKFKAPSIVSEQKFSNDVDFETLATKWREIRTEMGKLLNEIPPELQDSNIYKHAMAGRLTLDGMFQFFSGHFNRHRKQIERTLKAVGASRRA